MFTFDRNDRTTALAHINHRTNDEAYEILNKAKLLPIIPRYNVLTRWQVEEYFDVNGRMIQNLYNQLFYVQRKSMDTKSFDARASDNVELRLCDLKAVAKSYSKIGARHELGFSNGVKIVIPSTGAICFTSRAILKMAMFLDTSEVAEQIRKSIVRSPLCPSEWCANRLNIYENECNEEDAADRVELGSDLKEKVQLPADNRINGQIMLDKDSLVEVVRGIVYECLKEETKPQKHLRNNADVLGMMIKRIDQKKLSIARVTSALGISYQSWYRIVADYKNSTMLN